MSVCPSRNAQLSGLRDITRFERNQLDVVTGLRATAFALTPLALGLLSNQVGAGAIASLGALNEDVVSTLGAINLSFTEPGAASLLRRVGLLAAGCLVNAVAFSLGTLVGVSGSLAVPLVAAGAFAALIIRLRRDLFQMGLTSATVFVVGVGLPGGSYAAAYARFWLVLVGGGWALFGAILQWLAQRRLARGDAAPSKAVPPPPPAPPAVPSSREVGWHSLAVALTVAAALGIADYAGLARDYWVMLTVVVCVRLKPALTWSFTVMRVLGTVLGAVLALATTLVTGSSVLAVAPLFVFAVGMFSTRNASFVVFTLFLTSFIILLLNLAYPGDQQLALTRILDTCLGGALSLVASAALWSAYRGSDRGPRT
jgi:Fusaric acid resistance protein-like